MLHKTRRLTAALAAGALLATGASVLLGMQSAGAVPAGPTVTVTPTTGLVVAGADVSIAGTGFATTGAGIYVGVASLAKYDPANAAAFGAVKYVHLNGVPSAGQDKLAADGSFQTTLSFPAQFGSGANATDCRVEQCAIFTLAAHGSPDRTQDTVTNIAFVSASPSPTTTGPTPSPTVTTSAPATPTVSVTPTTDLTVAGADVSIAGTGFATTGQGIYVGVASRAKYDPLNADAFGVVKYVHLNGMPSAGQDKLAADGSFQTTLSFPAQFGTGANATDCRVEQCAIFTLAAHGSSDRSQDTATNITFAGAASPTAGTSTTPPVSTPSVAGDLAPSSVRPGGSVTVTASGFDAGEQVQAVLHSDPIDLGITPADEAGRFTLSFAVPADLETGTHQVVLLGLASGRQLSLPLVVSSAATTPVVELSPVGLADTGADSSGALVVGLALLLAGAGLSVAAARRPAMSGRRH